MSIPKIIVILLLFFSSLSLKAQLIDYLEVAKKNSPLINENTNLITVNGLEVERLKAFYTKPQVSVTANYLLAPIISNDNGNTKLEVNSTGASNYFGYDLASSNGGQYQAQLNITQPLFNEYRLKTVQEQLVVSSQINQNIAKLTAHDIEKIVTDQYILCFQDYRQINYTESMIKLLSEQKDLLQKLVSASIYKQSDLTLLNIEYQNFLLQRSQLKANIRRDFLDLNILCGINDTTVVELQNIELVINVVTEQSSYLEKYRLDSLNLFAQQKIFELKYKPQINWFANTGLNGVNVPDIWRRFGFSAGLSLTYNILDGSQKNISRNKTQLLQKSIAFYKDNFTRVNSLRKTKILNELASYTERMTIIQQQINDYNALINSYKKEIISGQLSIVNYLTTLKNMAIIQRDFTLLTSQKQTLINAYNYWNW